MKQKKTGVAAMVEAAVWLDSVCGMEVLGIGRGAHERADCTLEVVGSQLLVKISLQGGWIWVSSGSLDEGEPPALLFNVGDTAQGWVHVRRFVRALENSGLKSLKERPIRIGESGPNAYTID